MKTHLFTQLNKLSKDKQTIIIIVHEMAQLIYHNQLFLSNNFHEVEN